MTLTDIAERLNQDYGPQSKKGKKAEKAEKLPAAFFITDHTAVPDPEKIIARLSKKCGVIFRDYDHLERKQLGQQLSRACRDRGLIFLVAGDVELAQSLTADGVHLPEGKMAQAKDIHTAHPHWIITAACHSLSALKQAEGLPLDAALIAPVFPTLSHPETLSGASTTLGITGVQDMVAATDLPLYALGGITKENAGQLIGSGIVGLAAIRGFEGEETP
ncbi:MAG: thiamine phosphate synthase [Emcibacter sp.]|nr:thiamine phosphate synthase [Emcibacter sp.]